MILTKLNKITVTFHHGYPPLVIDPEKDFGKGKQFFTDDQMKLLPGKIRRSCKIQGLDVESIRFQGNGVECQKYRDGYLIKLEMGKN